MHSAGIQDRDGGISLLATMKGLFPFLEKLFADSAYQGPIFASALAKILPLLKTEIIKRSDHAKGFVRLPKRWIVERLDRPGGNITGFATREASMGGKWLELLSEIAPGLKRAAIMFSRDTASSSTYVPSFEMAARSLKVCQSLRPFIATQRSKRPSSPLGASREAGLLPCRMHS